MEKCLLDNLNTIPSNDKFVIKLLHQVIERFAKVHKVIFFGSRARGTHTPNSDTDIMFITDLQIENDLDIFHFSNSYCEKYKANVGLSIISMEEWDNPSFDEFVDMKNTLLKEGIEIINL